jgi:hypothetical protein
MSILPLSQIICRFWFPYRKFDLIYRKYVINLLKTRFKDFSNNNNYVPLILIFFNIYFVKVVSQKVKTIDIWDRGVTLNPELASSLFY